MYKYVKISQKGVTNFESLVFTFPYIYISMQISEEADEVLGAKTPLTISQFVEWSCAQFAQPVSLEDEIDDVESRPYLEREWR